MQKALLQPAALAPAKHRTYFPGFFQPKDFFFAVFPYPHEAHSFFFM